MNEQQLKQLLADSEPVLPNSDQKRLVRSLLRVGLENNDARQASHGFRTRRAIVTYLACGCAACLAIVLVATRDLLQDKPRFDGGGMIATSSEAPQEQMSHSNIDMDASLRSSEELEVEIVDLLANLRQRGERASDGSSFSDRSNNKSESSSRSSQLKRTLRDIRVQIRASEALAMLVEGSSENNVFSAAKIIEHYPTTPAAERLRVQGSVDVMP